MRDEDFGQRGAVLTMTLALFMVFLVIATTWLGLAVRQAHVTVDQEQEEQAFQVAEAGVEHTLFLLNSEVYTVDDLINLSDPIVQVVQDAAGNAVGSYELTFTDTGSTPLKVTSLAHDLEVTERCQQIVADIDVMTGSVDGPNYYARSWNHELGADCGVSGVVTALPTINFPSSGMLTVLEGDPPTVNKVSFPINLSHAYPLNVKVDFMTTGNAWLSATAGVDYVSKNETVTFSPGQTTRVVEVDIIADNVREWWWGISGLRYDYFKGVLSNPVNGSLGSPSERSARIEDDD